jgi:hypothetical protein
MGFRGWLLLTIVLLSSPGCGDPVKALREMPRTDTHWHAEPVDAIAPWGLANGKAAFFIPEANHTHSVVEHQEIPNLTVNLFPNGDLRFKGLDLKLRTGTVRDRRNACRALDRELSLMVGAPAFVAPDGSSLVSFSVHAAREAPWSSIREVIARARTAAYPMRQLHLCVDNPALAEDQIITAHMDYRRSHPRNALRVRLRVRAEDLNYEAHTQLDIDDREWVFADQADGFADPGFLARANEIWSEVEAWLPSVAFDAPVAQIEIADGEGEIWWAYVVKVLDLLLGVGVREVSIPDGDLHLVLADPDEIEVVSMEDEPVLAWQTIVGCLLAVLIAFAITFLPRARRRK